MGAKAAADHERIPHFGRGNIEFDKKRQVSIVDPSDQRSSALGPDVKPAKSGQQGDPDANAVLARTERLERRVRRLGAAILVLLAAFAYLLFAFVPVESLQQGAPVTKALTESKQFRLVDSSGNQRMLIRMYSDVPVVQLLDSNGETRMSMGLRFDETPFIDLSDHTGRTRAAVEVSQEGQPSFKLFDENGNPTFQVK